MCASAFSAFALRGTEEAIGRTTFRSFVTKQELNRNLMNCFFSVAF